MFSLFTPDMFFTVRGCENVHIYLWIAKDLCWINDNKAGIFFGACALLWVGVLFYHAEIHKNRREKFMTLILLIWLLANYIWMVGNLLYKTDVYRQQAANLMTLDLGLLGLYFIILKDLSCFMPSESAINAYNDNGLVPSLPCFATWRDYELVHVFFWLLKDYCWCTGDKRMWIIGAIPTLLFSIDFVRISFKNKKLLVDSCHYVATLIWVISNLTWACVELFSLGSDKSESYNRLSNHPNGRLIGALFLLLSYVPIFPIMILYFIYVILWKLNKLPKEYHQNLNISTEFFNDDVYL